MLYAPEIERRTRGLPRIMRNDPRNMNPDAETAGVTYPGPTDAAKMAAQDECEIGYTRCNIPLIHQVIELVRNPRWYHCFPVRTQH